MGRRLAAHLRGGEVLLLCGDLGAGKTELVRGLAQGLGLAPAEVSSPTFILIHEYHHGRLPLIHVDLYRLETPDEEFLLTLEDYWQPPAVTVIEWAERLGTQRPADYLLIQLEWQGADARIIRLAGHGPRGRELERALSSKVEL